MDNPNQYSFFNWNDQIYRDFIVDVLQNLEPITIPGKTVLYHELEESDLAYFFMEGHFDVGYCIDLEERFKLRFKNYSVVGLYGVTFFKRSQYIYRTHNTCSGYFIRRPKWKNIMDEQDDNVTVEFKDQITKEYEIRIKRRVNYYKSKDIERMALRADFDSHKFNSGIYDKGVIAAKRFQETKNHKKKSIKSFQLDGILPATIDAADSDDSSKSTKIVEETARLMRQQEKIFTKMLKRLERSHDVKIDRIVQLE